MVAMIGGSSTPPDIVLTLDMPRSMRPGVIWYVLAIYLAAS